MTGAGGKPDREPKNFRASCCVVTGFWVLLPACVQLSGCSSASKPPPPEPPPPPPVVMLMLVGKPGVTATGVAVLYRDIDNARWRAVAPVASNGTTNLSATVGRLAVTLQPTP